MARLSSLLCFFASTKPGRRGSSDSLEPLIEKTSLYSDSYEAKSLASTDGDLKTKEGVVERQDSRPETPLPEYSPPASLKFEEGLKRTRWSWIMRHFPFKDRWIQFRAKWSDSQRSQRIDEYLAEESEKRDKVILMMGDAPSAYEQWHYCIAKQEDIYPYEATPEALLIAKTFIFTFLTEVMRVTLADMKHKEITLCMDWAQRHIDALPDTFLLIECQALPYRLSQALSALWNDSDVQSHWKKIAPFATKDHINYFFKQLWRISEPQYVPSPEDVRRTYKLGLKNHGRGGWTHFRYQDRNWNVIDNDRLPCSRKKWMHGLHDLTSVIFTVDLRWYRETLAEDLQSNRLQCALDTWECVVNSHWFENSTFALCFVQHISFAEMVKTYPISECFPDSGVEDPADPKQAMTCVVQRFLSVNRRKDRGSISIRIMPDLPDQEEWIAVKRFFWYSERRPQICTKVLMA